MDKIYKKIKNMLYIPFYTSIIEILLIIVPALLSVAFVTVAERKTMASMQKRLGPNIAGYFGLLQAFADALKLLLKKFFPLITAYYLMLFISPVIILISFLPLTLLFFSLAELLYIFLHYLIKVLALFLLSVIRAPFIFTSRKAVPFILAFHGLRVSLFLFYGTSADLEYISGNPEIVQFAPASPIPEAELLSFVERMNRNFIGRSPLPRKILDLEHGQYNVEYGNINVGGFAATRVVGISVLDPHNQLAQGFQANAPRGTNSPFSVHLACVLFEMRKGGLNSATTTNILDPQILAYINDFKANKFNAQGPNTRLTNAVLNGLAGS